MGKHVDLNMYSWVIIWTFTFPSQETDKAAVASLSAFTISPVILPLAFLHLLCCPAEVLLVSLQQAEQITEPREDGERKTVAAAGDFGNPINGTKEKLSTFHSSFILKEK